MIQVQLIAQPSPDPSGEAPSPHDDCGHRVRFVEHAGGRVLYMDYSGIRTVEELERAAAAGTRAIQGEPPHSVVVLLDLTGVAFSLRIVRMLGEAAAANADLVRARAVVGLPAAAHPTVEAIAAFTGRPMQVFEDVSSALDWLIERARG